jgi:hypothetical protein
MQIHPKVAGEVTDLEFIHQIKIRQTANGNGK